MATSQLDTYIDQHLHHYLDLVMRFCAQPSVSAQNQGIREMAGLVKETLEARGLSVTVFETAGNPVVVGRATGRSDKTLLFYNHRILGAPITYAGVTHPGARFHAPDEHMRIDNFRAGCKHVARILDGFADAMRLG